MRSAIRLLVFALTLGFASEGIIGDTGRLRRDDLTVMVSGAFTAAYKTLVAEWQTATGHRVVTVSGASMGPSPTSIPNRLAAGEAADVVILARPSLDALVNAGRVIAGTASDLADSRIAMAVRAGTATPSIATERELREVLVDRKSTRLNSSHVSESRMPSSA